MKMIYPIDVCIKRYYRCYVEVDENETKEEIITAVQNEILENQDSELIENPNFIIEKDDIVWETIDSNGAWVSDETESTEEWGQTEWCQNCENENFYPHYDPKEKGYVTKCNHCGEEILLCDACMHADDNPTEMCNWHKTKTGGKCWRGETRDK